MGNLQKQTHPAADFSGDGLKCIRWVSGEMRGAEPVGLCDRPVRHVVLL